MLLAVLLLASVTTAAAARPPLRVLPLGDSITFGCGDECSRDCRRPPFTLPCSKCSAGYRAKLWKLLNASFPGAHDLARSPRREADALGEDEAERAPEGRPSPHLWHGTATTREHEQGQSCEDVSVEYSDSVGDVVRVGPNRL